MATFAVILPAAGQSTRFGANKRKKPFVELKGRAVWLRAAELFLNRTDVVQMLIVIAPEDVEWFKDRFRPNLAFMDIEIVKGGAQRADSVFNALTNVRDEVDFVAVHDAARPLLASEWIDTVFDAAQQSGAAIPAVRVDGTLKKVDLQDEIVETVSREGLWAAQTPQVFRRQLLLDAYAQRDELNPTDEAQLVEQLGSKITVVEGWPMNFKITTDEDFSMAKVVLAALPKKTLKSLHPFTDEEP